MSDFVPGLYPMNTAARLLGVDARNLRRRVVAGAYPGSELKPHQHCLVALTVHDFEMAQSRLQGETLSLSRAAERFHLSHRALQRQIAAGRFPGSHYDTRRKRWTVVVSVTAAAPGVQYVGISAATALLGLYPKRVRDLAKEGAFPGSSQNEHGSWTIKLTPALITQYGNPARPLAAVPPQLPPLPEFETQLAARLKEALKDAPLGSATGDLLRDDLSSEYTLLIYRALVGAEYGVTPVELQAHGRAVPVARARQVLYLALHRHGCTIAAIGRMLNRDHSTVLSGVEAMSLQPGPEAIVRSLAARAAPYLHAVQVRLGDRRAPDRGYFAETLSRKLKAPRPPAVVACVLDYAEGTLCGLRRRYDQSRAVAGLRFLCDDPTLRAALGDTLRALDMDAYVPLVERHGQQNGWL